MLGEVKTNSQPFMNEEKPLPQDGDLPSILLKREERKKNLNPTGDTCMPVVMESASEVH